MARYEKDEEFPQYNGKLIGFVVKTRRDLFKPLVGRPFNSPGDHDSLVQVMASQDAQPTLEQALALFDQDQTTPFVLIMRKPVPAGGMMGHWLKHMLSFQDAATAGSDESPSVQHHDASAD